MAIKSFKVYRSFLISLYKSTYFWRYKHFVRRWYEFYFAILRYNTTTRGGYTSSYLIIIVCLFDRGWSGFIVQLENFHSYGDDTITGEGLQILTYARHSWPLSSKGSLACHISCDLGHPFIMLITEDPWHSHLLRLAVGLWLSVYTIYICRSWESNTQPSTCGANFLVRSLCRLVRSFRWFVRSQSFIC